MAVITSKELDGISDLLTMEQNLVAKYREYASLTSDSVLRDKYEQIAAKHQRHFEELRSNLK